MTEKLASSVLDVRPIFGRGEAPCSAIDSAVDTLRSGQSLILLAPFEPLPLYTKLAKRGLEPHPERLPDGSWSIEFRPVTGPVSIPQAVGASESTHACGCGHE